MTSEIPVTRPDRDRGAEKAPSPKRFALLLFNSLNQVLLRRDAASGVWMPSEAGEGDPSSLQASADAIAAADAPVVSMFVAASGRGPLQVFFGHLSNAEAEARVEQGRGRFFTIEEVRGCLIAQAAAFCDDLRAIFAKIAPHVIRIPYLYKRENDYIYRFRTEKQRNRSVYHLDPHSDRLYQSALCQTIKAAKRTNERSSSSPAVVDFGAVSYVLPSHFGFCLGVQNAIERAYESIAENPGKRIFMLSELIHNPFVNEDLAARGLRYLQSDKGVPLADRESGIPFWESLTSEDIVIIPAFGATDSDKERLIEKGISLNRYDATCMLVEKVWKAAQRFGEAGYTVIIHGKAEHEETKATFSNAAKSAPALIIRNREEAAKLAAAILAGDPKEKRQLLAEFSDRCTPGFDAAHDLERVAVVNQTTLLRNETLGIIRLLEDVFEKKYGAEEVARRVNGNSKGDTLCYATQVNQDALEKALAMPIDLALVAGGKNSSNTYQLFRMCQERLGERAFYVQSERNLLSRDRVLHYVFPTNPNRGGEMVERSFLQPHKQPLRILLTGGASCPDGIIQQIITRINDLFPPGELRPVQEVLRDWERAILR